jgi:hypothetical protein
MLQAILLGSYQPPEIDEALHDRLLMNTHAAEERREAKENLEFLLMASKHSKKVVTRKQL